VAETETTTTTVTTNSKSASPTPEEKTKQKKSKKKANKKATKLIVAQEGGVSLEWNTITSRSLWTQISDECMAQYHYEITL